VARSLRFQQLESALRELRKQLLPRQFDPTGTYPDRIISRARGYRVLAHAEIEHFIEERAQEVVLHALRDWNSSGLVRKTLLSLVAFSGRNADPPPDTLLAASVSAQPKHDILLHLKFRLDQAANAFFAAVNDNHGLKERNVLRLLLPVGIDPNDFDPLWLATMNSFGERRGEAAHISGSYGAVRHPPDPKSEFNIVVDVIKGLKDIDENLTLLKK
jgi:hypothetical protein